MYTVHVAAQNCGYSIVETTSSISCNGFCDGALSITITGGNSPYTFSWSDDNNTSTSSISSLCGGSYSVTVSDAVSCDSTYTINKIINPEPLSVNLIKIDIICEINGIVSANPTGGRAPYKYVFTGYSDSLDTPYFEDLPEGNYTYTVVDSLNCYADTTFDIVVLTCVDPIPSDAFSPNGDAINDHWSIENLNYFLNYRIYVYSRWGQLVFDSNKDAMPWKGEGVFGTVPAATYYYIMVLDQSDKNSKIVKGSVSVVR
ncbi:MAG: gliding motility-associated C-terminal domain-containing protein [Flavobacteriales bacterium]|nr:gliding motility-associated C-terminal domain-containing protein [Flavobacteriales bacterium]